MKRTLVIGASENPSRYANIATRMLKEYGHPVIAYGRKQGFIDETPIATEFPSGQEFDTVTLYLNPTNQESYILRILEMKPKRVIFNPGTENESFEKTLKDAGIEPVEGCTLVMLRTNQY
jgi:predicted CoA-binding protein